ncbi:MAG: argininosuccinate synthase, partial [Clostridia bacterium]|nr:argininosuccinate synthase [Clostridia bacterium]
FVLGGRSVGPWLTAFAFGTSYFSAVIFVGYAGTILYFAHDQLEMLTVDKDTLHLKQKLAVDYADLIYNGKWYSPLQEALTAFANESNKYVTGTVKLKLYKGNIIPAGTTSPYSLYSEDLATFDESDYDQKDAQGFINLWGLPTKIQAMRDAKIKNN